MKQVIRPPARRDILEQFRFYLLADALDAATRFLEAIDESVEAICEMPQAGAPMRLKNPTLEGLRFRPVKDFEDILIFYLIRRDSVVVARVLHGKRNIKRILERARQ